MSFANLPHVRESVQERRPDAVAVKEKKVKKNSASVADKNANADGVKKKGRKKKLADFWADAAKQRAEGVETDAVQDKVMCLSSEVLFCFTFYLS